MCPLRTTVWCGFWAGGVITLLFFETDKELQLRHVIHSVMAKLNWKLTISGFSRREWPATPHAKRMHYSSKSAGMSDNLAW